MQHTFPKIKFGYGAYALSYLVITSENIGMLSAQGTVRIVDYETVQSILRIAKGDIAILLNLLDRDRWVEEAKKSFSILTGKRETSYYPPGDGWMWEHGDRMGDLEHWHFIVPLTFRGPDFTGGGLTLVDRTGNRVDVDARMRPGSVVFYDGRLPHGVSRISCDRNPPVGRLQMFAIPVVFEPPETADRLIRSIPLARYARARLSVLKRRLKRLAGA